MSARLPPDTDTRNTTSASPDWMHSASAGQRESEATRSKATLSGVDAPAVTCPGCKVSSVRNGPSGLLGDEHAVVPASSTPAARLRILLLNMANGDLACGGGRRLDSIAGS